MGPRHALTIVACALLFGCGGSEGGDPPEPDPPPEDCAGVVIGDDCVVTGLAPTDCAEGFEHREGGCFPLRPPTPCGDDEVAWLGETSCHPVADCGTGPWPEPPAGATAIYVDASQTGGDGSMANPFGLLVDAIDAAPADATLLLAEGTYVGKALDKPLGIIGRCPALVHLENIPTYNTTYVVLFGGAGSGLRGVTLTDGLVGSATIAGQGVSMAEVILDGGMAVTNVQGGASLELRDSLLRRGAHVIVQASTFSADRIVSRDRGGVVDRLRVAGIPGEYGGTNQIALSRAIFEDVIAAAVGSAHGSAQVVATAISGRPGATKSSGLIQGAEVDGSYVPSDALFEDVTVAGFAGVGIGTDASESVVRRATIVDAQPVEPYLGVGMVASDPRGSLTADQIHMARARTSAVQINLSAQATLSRVRIEETQADVQGLFGDGVTVIDASAVVVDSLLGSSTRAGAAAFDGLLDLRDVVMRCNAIDLSVQEVYGGAELVDSGGNRCGCGETTTCKAASTALEPPEPPQIQ